MLRFSDLLKQANAENHSAAELARRAGLLPRTVQYVLSGEKEPTLETAHRLALALGVPLTDLLPEIELPEPVVARPRGRPRKQSATD